MADEQLAHLADEADDARLRALVSETPLAEHEHREAERHADAWPATAPTSSSEIAKLEPSRTSCSTSCQSASILNPMDAPDRRPTTRTPRRCPPASSSPRTRPSSASTSRRPSRRRATRSWARPAAATRPSSWSREHEPDLAILDIKMPGLDGLCGRPRDHRASATAAVLILTAFSQRDLIEQARDAGALAYLVKPFQKRPTWCPPSRSPSAASARCRRWSTRTTSLEEQLETRKVVDRAKGRSWTSTACSEGDAFSFIQKTAMHDRDDRCRPSPTTVIAGDARRPDAVRPA